MAEYPFCAIPLSFFSFFFQVPIFNLLPILISYALLFCFPIQPAANSGKMLWSSAPAWDLTPSQISNLPFFQKSWFPSINSFVSWKGGMFINCITILVQQNDNLKHYSQNNNIIMICRVLFTKHHYEYWSLKAFKIKMWEWATPFFPSPWN